MHEHALGVGVCAGDEGAGHFDRVLGVGLGLSEPGDLLLVLGAAFDDAELGIADDLDAGFAHLVEEDHGQRAVDGAGGDAMGDEALRDGLRGGDFAIAGEAGGRREVGGAEDRVGAGVGLGAVHLDIANDEDGGLAIDFDDGGGIAHEETDAVIENAVERGNARPDANGGGVSVLGHGDHPYAKCSVKLSARRGAGKPYSTALGCGTQQTREGLYDRRLIHFIRRLP